jgi:hypothetical protein
LVRPTKASNRTATLPVMPHSVGDHETLATMKRHATTARGVMRSVLLIGFLLISPAVRASSDGDFCHTDNYLAYELSLGLGLDHNELHVISLEAPLRSASRRTISLPPPRFQVHGLLCTKSEIQVLGWTDLHYVSLTPSHAPLSVRSARLPSPGYRPVQIPVPTRNYNLGPLARPKLMSVGTPLTGLKLRIAVTSEGPCDVRIVSTLEQSQEEIASHLVLYDQIVGTECADRH